MSVISVSITESEEQVVFGIPKTVSISTNIPSTIFYTLDGSEPDLFSNIYTSPINIQYNSNLSITLKVLATNGIDYSLIVTETYITNILNNARLPHSSTDAEAESAIPGLYPFGTNPIQPDTAYLNPGDAGITVNNPEIPSTATGFDGDGYETGYTNNPYNIENYSIVYSTRNAEGESKIGVGTLPGTVKIEQEPAIPEYTSQFTSTFDPRAFVIFQDFEKENPEDPPNINRQFFSLEDPNKARDGNNYYTAGIDAPPVNGTFLRSHYNPRDNSMTYYYLDTWTNKWIISKTPYQPTGPFDGNLSGVAVSKEKGAGFVFQWVNFPRRVLF
jgi:hypothetical protein